MSAAGGSVGLFGYTPTGVGGALDASVYKVMSFHATNYDAASGYTYVGMIQPYYGRYLDPKGQLQGYFAVGTSQIPRRFGVAYQDGSTSSNVTSNSASGEFSGGTGSGGGSNGYVSCAGGNGGGGGSGAGYYLSSSAYYLGLSGAGGDGRCVIEWAPDA